MVEILRDPCGHVACYHAALDGTHFFTSSPHLLFDSRLLRAELDWTAIAQTLAFRDLRGELTPLRGVSELLPGSIARIVGDRLETRCAWSPWTFASPAREIASEQV